MPSSRGTRLLTSVFKSGAPDAIWPRVKDHASIEPIPPPVRTAIAKLPSSSRRRTQIWDLHHSLHCSIIGTCLTTAELQAASGPAAGCRRRNGRRARAAHAGCPTCRPAQGGSNSFAESSRSAHQLAVNQFAKAKDAAAVSALWENALERGDIPGTYWALLTHPATTDRMVKDVFGKVHMLSHLVGAANRADIRRLRQLEEDNAALAAKLERQQRQLRDGFTGRDETIRRLNDMLARAVGQEPRQRRLKRPRTKEWSRTRWPSWIGVWRMKPAVASVSSSGWRPCRALSTRPSARGSGPKASLRRFIRSSPPWRPGSGRRCRPRTAVGRMGSTCTA